MKKLLSMLAVSTLSVTSASNLKPLFTSNVSQGFKSNENNKDISIHVENDTNPLINKFDFFKEGSVISVTALSNGTVWIGTRITTGSGKLYKSTDSGKTFAEVQGVNGEVRKVAIAPDGAVWIATLGLYKFDFVGNLLNLKNANYYNGFNNFVYNYA